MKQKRNLAIAIVLSTAAGFLALQNVSAPAPDAPAQMPEMETIVAEPTITEPPVPENAPMFGRTTTHPN